MNEKNKADFENELVNIFNQAIRAGNVVPFTTNDSFAHRSRNKGAAYTTFDGGQP
jgi:uncharacterized cupin superfamily protein